jgi:hypothetical protein
MDMLMLICWFAGDNKMAFWKAVKKIYEFLENYSFSVDFTPEFSIVPDTLGNVRGIFCVRRGA